MLIDDELRFEYWLADRLRMPVAELRQRVSAVEFLAWTRYHALRAAEERMRWEHGHGSR